jgi:hypothetical protein
MYVCYETVVIEYRVIALGPGAEFELDQEAAHTDFQGPHATAQIFQRRRSITEVSVLLAIRQYSGRATTV